MRTHTGPFGASRPVSRVLSFKTAIYLDAPLPTRSSRLPGTVGPTCVSLHGVAPDRVYSDGRFHAVGVGNNNAFYVFNYVSAYLNLCPFHLVSKNSPAFCRGIGNGNRLCAAHCRYKLFL